MRPYKRTLLGVVVKGKSGVMTNHETREALTGVCWVLLVGRGGLHLRAI